MIKKKATRALPSTAKASSKEHKARLLLEVKDLSKSFKQNKVLQGLNLNLFQNESLVVLGRSGTGKSVLIKCIIGLMQPNSGSIKLDGEETIELSEQRRRDLMHKFGFLFQSGALFDSLPVWHNVAFFLIHNKNLPIKEARNLAAETLAKVGLSNDVLDLLPQQLSGGMQKRVAFARTIAHSPEILLLDEPTTGLDPYMTHVIDELIIQARELHKYTSITITHDLASTRSIATRVAMLDKGDIVWNGSVKELDSTNNKIVQRFIHGEA
jgi:phospholipid/cholesterol/gamma-HCH transport system ATP-binding protein